MAANKDKIRATAQKFLQKGQIDKAIREFQRLVDDDPKDVRTLLKIGDLQTRAGKHAEATETYSRVAQFYAEQGFFLKAVAVYKEILKIDPTLVDVNLKLAELYHQLGLLSDATNQYRQISQIYEKQGRIDDAIDVLRKMVELDPENVASRIKLAEMFAKQQMVEEARNEFRAAAAFLKSHHRIDDYIKVAERIVHFDPTDLETTRELANIYIQKNDARRALAKLQVCFKANPKDVETLSLLANAFRDLGQTQKTVSVYRELARIHLDNGDHEAHVAVMRKVLDVAPDDAEARAALQQALQPQPMARVQPAQRGIPIREVDRRDAVVEAEPDEIELEPDEVELEDAVGPEPEPAGADAIIRILTEVEVYIKYGLKNKALEHVQRIFEIDPHHREARTKYKDLLLEMRDTAGAARELLLLADIAHGDGDSDRARNDLEELLGIDPTHAEARQLLDQLDGAAAPDNEELEPAKVGLDADEVPAVVRHGGSDAPLLSYEPSPAAAEIDLDDDSDLAGMVDEPLEIEAEEEVAAVVSGESELRPPRGRPSEVAGARSLDVAQSTMLSQSGSSEVNLAPPEPAAGAAGGAALDRELDDLLASVPGRAPGVVTAEAEAEPLEAEPIEAEPIDDEPIEVEPIDDEPIEVEPIEVESESEGETEVAAEQSDLSDEIEEIEFFLQQGLEDEAHDSLRALLLGHPNHPGLLALEEQLAATSAAVEPEPVPSVEPEPEPEPETIEYETVDLATELADDFREAVDDDFQVSFTDVFDEFKKGVAETVDEGDYETHYNLGIAYKEMGLLEDAVREFETAQADAARTIGALTMKGICQLELGETEAALESFLGGLNADGVTPEEAMALRYEIGLAYENMGKFRDAGKFFEKVHAMDQSFRDVAVRLAEVQNHADEQTDDVSDELDALLDDTPPQSKADKISYL